jgi:hypothetical protein
MSYAHEAGQTSLARQPATLDTIIGQITGLVNQASENAIGVEHIADEMCGVTPETVSAASDGKDGSFNGKLDAISKLLDMVSYHQQRANVAGRRISSAVLLSPDSAKQFDLSGTPRQAGAVLPRQGSY